MIIITISWYYLNIIFFSGVFENEKRKKNQTKYFDVFWVKYEDEMEIDNENACFHKRPLQNTEHTYHFKVYTIRFYIVEE